MDIDLQLIRPVYQDASGLFFLSHWSGGAGGFRLLLHYMHFTGEALVKQNLSTED